MSVQEVWLLPGGVLPFLIRYMARNHYVSTHAVVCINRNTASVARTLSLREKLTCDVGLVRVDEENVRYYCDRTDRLVCKKFDYNYRSMVKVYAYSETFQRQITDICEIWSMVDLQMTVVFFRGFVRCFVADHPLTYAAISQSELDIFNVNFAERATLPDDISAGFGAGTGDPIDTVKERATYFGDPNDPTYDLRLLIELTHDPICTTVQQKRNIWYTALNWLTGLTVENDVDWYE